MEYTIMMRRLVLLYPVFFNHILAFPPHSSLSPNPFFPCNYPSPHYRKVLDTASASIAAGQLPRFGWVLSSSRMAIPYSYCSLLLYLTAILFELQIYAIFTFLGCLLISNISIRMLESTCVGNYCWLEGIRNNRVVDIWGSDFLW